MKKMIVVFALAIAACAGASRNVESRKDPLPGHWVGVIDREGWQRPLSIMIDSKEGRYAGSWMSLENQPGIMVEGLRRSSDAVHIELAALVFDGKLAGRTLADRGEQGRRERRQLRAHPSRPDLPGSGGRDTLIPPPRRPRRPACNGTARPATENQRRRDTWPILTTSS